MTTAPTPSEAHELLDWFRESDGFGQGTKAPHKWVLRAEQELRRLQADNEAMRETLEFVERWAVHHASKPHMTAELALGSIQHHPEIRAITERYADGKRPETFDPYARIAELEARKPLPLSDEQIDAIADGMPRGLAGFMKTWGWRQFARKILDLRAMPTWEPGFDFMAPGQEELAMQFCLEIAGPRGKKGSPPDPVRLMEMCQALYKAEADARLVDKSPDLQEPLVDKTANLQDRPLPLSDAEIIAAQAALALSRSRIGLPCSRCESGKYRADSNAYHDFHRCDSCMHVPMWGEDGKEIGPPTCAGESS
ncbi:hypothetical protein DR66_6069 [Delftia acidovorans]|uniref:hypothetical protein n=1 Tax=Delftia acidovorans TaxID=80866 RepID=UPI0005086629|nr:hypothetical protein [Delftia acidovorans]KFJ08708.1 hypothetical protein DR66_6069 [Delftia acidovorans]